MVQVERTQRKPGGSMSQAGVSSNWLNVYGEICFLIRDQSNEALVVASPQVHLKAHKSGNVHNTMLPRLGPAVVLGAVI